MALAGQFAQVYTFLVVAFARETPRETRMGCSASTPAVAPAPAPEKIKGPKFKRPGRRESAAMRELRETEEEDAKVEAEEKRGSRRESAAMRELRQTEEEEAAEAAAEAEKAKSPPPSPPPSPPSSARRSPRARQDQVLPP